MATSSFRTGVTTGITVRRSTKLATSLTPHPPDSPLPTFMHAQSFGTRRRRMVALFLKFFPLILFSSLHGICFFIWRLWLGSSAWPPAFPLARTQLAVLMVSVPLWAATMSCWTYFRPRQQNDSYDYALLGAENTRRSKKRRRVQPYVPYLVVLGLGLFVLSSSLLNNESLRTTFRSKVIRKDKIFIAAMFHNNQDVLPYWSKEMIKVINYLGKENVFVSVLESYSQDNSPDLVKSFDAQLETMGVERSILINDTSIPLPASMETTNTRIEYLSKLRNRALEHLITNGGYDRILFSNDIYVQAESVIELLETRNGDWDMVCGLDFDRWGLYDSWVIRDRTGHLVSSLWPYFLDDEGKQAVIASKPAPVFSCWNGIAAFRPDPFLPPHLRPQNSPLSRTALPQPLPQSHPAYSSGNETLTPAKQPAMQFRASNQGECFSSECFTIAYDFRRQYGLNKIFVNPRVITAYQWKHYFWFKYVTRHWLIRLWMKYVERGRGLEEARMIVGSPEKVWVWEGVECHPWW